MLTEETNRVFDDE